MEIKYWCFKSYFNLREIDVGQKMRFRLLQDGILCVGVTWITLDIHATSPILKLCLKTNFLLTPDPSPDVASFPSDHSSLLQEHCTYTKIHAFLNKFYSCLSRLLFSLLLGRVEITTFLTE
jgi:hypothetical protein